MANYEAKSEAMDQLEETDADIVNKMETYPILSEHDRLVNLSRVKFTKPIPKKIISHHAGCDILTRLHDEFVVKSETSEMFIEKAKRYMQSLQTSSPQSDDSNSLSLPETKVKDLLVYCGLTGKFPIGTQDVNVDQILHSILCRFGITLSEQSDQTIPESTVYDLVNRFHVTSSTCGHMLRKLCARGEIDEIIELHVRGCDPNAADGDGLSALHYAAELNKYNVINLLCKLHGKELAIDCQDKYGWSPLHSACYFGSIDAVRILTENGANLSLGDIYGVTPLHMASGRGHLTIIRYLLSEMNVDASVTCKKGMTAAHKAAFHGQLEAYNLILSFESFDSSIKDNLGFVADDYIVQRMENTAEKFNMI